MKKRSALLLALPASLFWQVFLNSDQSYEAATVSSPVGMQQQETIDQPLKIASFSSPPLPSLGSPMPHFPAATGSPSPAIKTPLRFAPGRGQSIDSAIAPAKTKAIKVLTKPSAKAKKIADQGPKFVSLTFDDGPSPVYTTQILAILKKEGIHATFCVIGREAKRYPTMLQQIVAEGHKIADHSMNHDLNLRKRSDKKIKEEILATKTLIETIVPGTTVEHFRAPGGNWSPHLKEMVKSWGMKPLGWSVDTKDWQKPGVDEIISKVDAELHPGGVILMHDSGGDRSETVEALEKVIAQLKKDGYQFVFPG